MQFSPFAQDGTRSTPQGGAVGKTITTASSRWWSSPDYPKIRLVAILCLQAAVLESSELVLFMQRNPIELQRHRTIVSVVEGTASLLGGLFWGILASQVVLSRKQVLILASLVQGVVLLIGGIKDWGFWPYFILHILSTFVSSALRPLSRNIVADVFPLKSAGSIYGFRNACYIIGWLFWERLVNRLKHYGETGWRSLFLIAGISSLLTAALLGFRLLAPLSVPSRRTTKQELEKLMFFLKIPSFLLLVVQGSFGSMPWNFIWLQQTFFESVGLSGNFSAFLYFAGQVVGSMGSIFGGNVADRLASRSFLSGRIWAAQFSVFSGIPLGYLLYMWPTAPVWYFVIVAMVFHFMISWSDSGTNPQITCSITTDDERTLAFTSHWAMQQASGKLGTLVFFAVAEKGFDYRFDMGAAGDPKVFGPAMFWASSVPWLICGSLYSLLHWTFPKDVEETIIRANGQPHMHTTRSEVSMAASELSDFSSGVGTY